MGQAAVPIAIGLSGLFGGLGAANSGQDRTSFAGTAVDPTDLMTEQANNLRGFGSALTKRLGEGISLPDAYVQDLPTFTGGGLPQPIGLSGRDPALKDPSRLSLPGIDLPDIFQATPRAATSKAPGTPIPPPPGVKPGPTVGDPYPTTPTYPGGAKPPAQAAQATAVSDTSVPGSIAQIGEGIAPAGAFSTARRKLGQQTAMDPSDPTNLTDNPLAASGAATLLLHVLQQGA